MLKSTTYSVLVLATFASACGDDCTPDSSYEPGLSAAQFSAPASNPLYPLVPGTRRVFEGAGERIEVTVTAEKKMILGIEAIVVRDTVTDLEDSSLIEDTFDWYATDNEGTVWYLGEDTKEYVDGEVTSTEGSWEAGVDGAKGGVVMHGAQPAIGAPYRQEYYACEAEDMAEITATGVAVSVPYGSFTGCLKTREFTPLEPDVNEYKYYCPEVGLVLEENIVTGEKIELVEITVP
jgi:hypothetical protein